MRQAPGHPGIAPTWTSSDKLGVGTALSPLSRVWFTLSHGILNEIYYPRLDQACLRDFGFIVTGPDGFFTEEKRDAQHRVDPLADGVPAYCLRSECVAGRYDILKTVITDPRRDVVLQQVELRPRGDAPLRLFALLSPHLVNGGAHNTGWIGTYKGVQMLFAENDGTAIAVAASVPFRACSVGFVGASDGWGMLRRDGELSEQYDRAEDGNIALTGELDLRGAPGQMTSGPVTVALGFGRTWSEAAYRVRASLAHGFAAALDEYQTGWRQWQAGLLRLDRKANGHNSYRISTATLRAHDSPSFPGGIIASLSIPWGSSRGDDDLGGYHLVWPRDLAETGGALIACGAYPEARRVLSYLRATQEPDGSWPQNNWLDGIAYWRGVQIDETAFPLLLLDLARRNGLVAEAGLEPYADMVRRAAGFLLRVGPITGQDRWEENSGFSPFTLAVEVAALLAAADMMEQWGEMPAAALLRDTADAWNAAIEDWTYVAGTKLAREAGVAGYYVRIAPAEGPQGAIQIRNRVTGQGVLAASDVISPDALALVRFGLRAADDPRIRDTIVVIDRILRVELPAGPCWHRYNGDGYGEHADGSPFDGTGIGRAWPLMTGERAHYALAAGAREEAHELLETMEHLSSRGGLLPEQVWDTDDIPGRELVRGCPSGSAMPLVWAHAEHIKLCRSLGDGRVFDMPTQTVERYLVRRVAPRCQVWREDLPPQTLASGGVLRIDLPRDSVVHWSDDDWASTHDTPTRDTGFDWHVADLAPRAGAARLRFTWRDVASGAWAGRDVVVTASG